MKYSWTQIMFTWYILSCLSAIIVLAIALEQCNKKCPKDSYCSCHGVQYDGSAGDPDMQIYPGTYCTNKKAVRKAYREGRTIDAV